MKKLAFLIMAHHDLPQLTRLIMALDYPMFDLYVHLDKRSSLDPKTLNELSMHHGRLKVVPFRHKIYWGDISVVDATFHMYRYAMKQGDYSRLVTLSGNDYPICSNADIYHILSDDNTEFIVGQKGLYPEAENYRVRHYHFFKPYPRWLINPIKNKLRKYQIKKPLQITTNRMVYDIYQASQWHALTPECVRYVLDVAKREPAIRRYFRYSWAPDELMLPTILFASPYREKTLCYNDNEIKDFNKLAGITYLEYNPQSGSTVNWLNETAYEQIIRSDRLFLRKVATGKSGKLMDLLDEYRK